MGQNKEPEIYPVVNETLIKMVFHISGKLLNHSVSSLGKFLKSRKLYPFTIHKHACI